MATELQIPQVGESIPSVFIAGWSVKVGDFVNAGDPVLEIDSDKASMDVPSPISGKILELRGEEGDEIEIGAVVAIIDETATQGDSSAPSTPAPAAASEDKPEQAAASSAAPGGPAGPAARAAANQKGVDLSTVAGSGKRGRIHSSDVQSAPAQAAAVAQGGVSQPAPAASEQLVERVKMTPLRRTIARRLVQAQQEAAMLTTFNEVDMTGILDIRKRYQDFFVKKYGYKLGFMPFFVKAVVEALKEFPAVNAEIDGNEIVYKRYYNIGVAVSGPKGLTVPVLRDADRLSMAQTEGGIRELATRARDNKLGLDDFKDGTFTISNGGVFGSLMSTPIINPPQVGILGMHAMVNRPVAVNGQVEIRPMMYLALSYDHRIIDGREAVSFLVKVKQLVENPERILIEV
ncbi:MAG: 2-oxoglutarate dehydrogenase complex dihydrolipoyllysine-residue succinyltransferase [Myxococcota bacterium]|nr:2-oxoglutarate dehydrogenase complex dihydrolipoyllysine-residue succinyltransferase [Myxococcota bacterium]